ncbi:MAG: SpoIIE family protein phosphatase [Lentisphaeria bacterium]|nr:SpoIIE family protein phosphatase [Lentisphaeria bacterium]
MNNINITLGVLSLIFLITILVLSVAWRRLRARLTLVVRQQTEIDHFLDLFSRSLRSNDEISDSMHQAAEYIAELIMAEAVCIYRLEKDRLFVSGVSGRYPLSQLTININEEASPDFYKQILQEEDIAVGEGFIGRTASRKSSILLTDARHDEHLSEFPMERLPEQVMAVPVFRGDELSGLICAVANTNWGRFNMDKLSQLQFAASQVRLIHDLEDSYKVRSAQERLNQELGFARKLQASLLPSPIPEWGSFSVFAKTTSAKEVNGDFYDIVRIDDDRLLIVMGDACGKGIPACLLASMTRSFIRAAAEHFTSLEALLREVNRNLYRDTDAERFVTLGCCLLDKKHGLMEYARAGHTELIYFIRNHIRRLYPDGTGLGILPDEFATFDTICVQMPPGMSLLLYSDGITEALDYRGEEFGVDRLADEFEMRCCAKMSVEEVLDGLMDVVNDFEPDQHDDRTAIMIRS